MAKAAQKKKLPLSLMMRTDAGKHFLFMFSFFQRVIFYCLSAWRRHDGNIFIYLLVNLLIFLRFLFHCENEKVSSCFGGKLNKFS